MSQSDKPIDDTLPNSVGIPSVTINWYRTAAWLRVLKLVLSLSWRGSHILVCSIGLLVTELCIFLINRAFPNATPLAGWIDASRLHYSPVARDLEIGSPSYLTVWSHYLSPVSNWMHQQTLSTTASSVAMILSVMAIWSFLGGCLTRRTIVECGTGVTAPWLDTFRLVFKRWGSIVGATLGPGLVLTMLALVPIFLGLASRVPWIGWILATICLVPILLAVLPAAWLAAPTIFGFPLSISAIVTERNADALEGFSRTTSQIFERPLLLIVLVAVGQLISVAASELFGSILWFANTILFAGFELGASHEMVSRQAILLQGIPILLISAFGFSFFWSFSAISYLIVRRDINGADFDLIDMPMRESTQATPKIAVETQSPIQGSSVPSDASTDVG
jgi:hypothetical protein